MRHLLLFTLAACGGKDGDAPSDDSAADDSAAPGATAVVTTVADDYSVGALATVALDDWQLQDSLTDLTGDSVVSVSGGYVFLIHRYNYDTIGIYRPGQWAAPVAELALANQANPHDVEVCEGLAFVSQYGVDQLVVIDPETGLLAGAVDLSAYADADGRPEASTMTLGDDGHLYVGLHNLDRDAGWVSDSGHVLQVDCAAQRVSQSWATSASADVYPHAPGALLVSVLGEGLRVLDTEAGTLSELVYEGPHVAGLASDGARVVAAIAQDDDSYDIGCIDLSDGALTTAEEIANYLIHVAGDGQGRAWLSARQHWSEPEGDKGLVVYDIATCSSVAPGDMLSTSLAPFSVAFY